jgi:hypothetical protein
LSNINWTDKAGFNQKNISIDISFSNSNLWNIINMSGIKQLFYNSFSIYNGPFNTAE